MSSGGSPYYNPKRYIPATLSEINDMLGSMLLWAPTFHSASFPDRNVDSRFDQLFEGFVLVQKKVGGERYAQLVDLAGRAKALFKDDQEDKNGKADQGRALLYEIEELIRQARAHRTAAKLKDEEGRVTGD